LKDNPNISGNLLKIQNERSALQELLSRTVRELQDGSFKTLILQVEEDKQEQDKLTEIIRREKETAAAVRQLEQGSSYFFYGSS
jgi:hypothetical protein